jgi:hypothetical protein
MEEKASCVLIRGRGFEVWSAREVSPILAVGLKNRTCESSKSITERKDR